MSDRAAPTRIGDLRRRPGGRLCRGLSGLALATILSCAGGLEAARAGSPGEYEAKAAFLINFGRFVEWPASAFGSSDAPFRLCIAGSDPFGRTLDDIVRDERIDTHPIQIIREASRAPDRCHLLFVSPSLRAVYASIVRTVDRTRVLTAGDELPFLDAGGQLAFFLEHDEVRFAVSRRGIDAASELRISSKLLRLARPYPPGRQEP
jgi:YfiR/HmsC-like